MTRRYGRSPVGQRLVCAVPQGHYQTTTMIAAVRLRGPQAPGRFDGPMDGELFLAWVQQGLVPALQRDDVVICPRTRWRASGRPLRRPGRGWSIYRRIRRTSPRLKICGARSNRGSKAVLPAMPANGSRPSVPPSTPSPQKTAVVSFYTPDTLHDLWKCSSFWPLIADYPFPTTA
jgi:hypothetical protein